MAQDQDERAAAPIELVQASADQRAAGALALMPWLDRDRTQSHALNCSAIVAVDRGRAEHGVANDPFVDCYSNEREDVGTVRAKPIDQRRFIRPAKGALVDFVYGADIFSALRPDSE